MLTRTSVELGKIRNYVAVFYQHAYGTSAGTEAICLESSVVVIDLGYDILNYNYLNLKSQLLPITITQILRQ